MRYDQLEHAIRAACEVSQVSPGELKSRGIRLELKNV